MQIDTYLYIDTCIHITNAQYVKLMNIQKSKSNKYNLVFKKSNMNYFLIRLTFKRKPFFVFIAIMPIIKCI